MKLGLAAMAVALVGIASNGNAQSIGDDLKCLIVSNALKQSAKNPRTRSLTELTSAFYLGRVDARAQSRAISNALKPNDVVLPGPVAIATFKKCVERAEAANQRLKDIAKQAAASK
jgi:hypothetical protein